MQIKVTTLEQTQKLAEQLARNLQAGTVIALNGELGSGKTTFARFLAKACGSTDNVRSPTFNLLNIYTDGTWPIYHFDFYRLNSRADLENIGGLDFIPSQDGVTLIEWAEKFPEILPEAYLEIRIALEEEMRVFDFISYGREKRLLNIGRPLENPSKPKNS